MRIVRLMNNLAKRFEKWRLKCSGYVENYTTIGLRISRYGAAQVFIDFFFRKSSNILKPIRCVRFTKAVVRHANIRDQKPSLGKFAQVILISVTPMLQILRIGLRKRRNGKSDAPAKQRGSWPKISSKLKEKDKTAFFSPSENRCLPASTLIPEEREFVVDSGASMHMISKKDLNDAEMDTLTKSCSPAIVIPANGELQTHEEAIVYVKELDIFLTMKVLEGTPAVLSSGKLCDEHGYSYEWINGQKQISFLKRYSDTVQHGELRSDRGSWFINEFFLKLVYLTNHDNFNCVKRKCG